MHAAIRRYQHASALADALEARQEEVNALLAAVPGFVTYYVVRTDDGGVASVTVCQDRAGTTESTRVASEWVRTTLIDGDLAAPEVAAGDIVLHFSGPVGR
jgi:heme-degrading monooxygenase HmoA